MRMAARLAAAICVFGMFVAVCPASAQHRETLKVESRFHGKPFAIPVTLVLPERHDGGRLPVMVIMHGSGGVRDVREFAYAREFNAMGVAAAVIDSFAPRGVKSTVRDQSPVSSYDMVVDAVSTLKALAHRPDIDPARIGLIGFSKGGTVAIKVALRRYMEPLAGGEARFAVLIAMYPWCGDLPLDFGAASPAPLHMLSGEQDHYAGTESCKEYARRFAAAGGNVTLKIFPGAEHDWDVPGRTHWSIAAGENGSKCIYDEVSPGTWIERRSKLAIVENNRPARDRKKAMASCVTFGVSGGYNRDVRAQSMSDIRGFVRSAFTLQ